MSDAAEHCLKLLRSGDYDRYISVLFAPREYRGDLAALYAFDLEIARVSHMVKEPLAGEIRLRWWRDGLERGAGDGQAPVMTGLLAAIKRHALPVPAFLRLCDARVFDLYHDAMPDRAGLEGYYGDTSAAVMQLACHILGREAASLCTDACAHGGVARGISGLLQLLPLTTRRDQLYIPRDILTAVGTTREALRGSAPDVAARARVAAAMLALAYEHYDAFAAAVKNTPAGVRAAFLPLAVLPATLKQLKTLGPDVFEHRGHLSRLRRQWLISRAALTGSFIYKP